MAERPVVGGRLGEHVRRLREEAGLSRDELAGRVAVGHAQLSKIEKGERLCRSDTLVKLAASLDATPNDLLAGIEWDPAEDPGGFELESSEGGDGEE